MPGKQVWLLCVLVKCGEWWAPWVNGGCVAPYRGFVTASGSSLGEVTFLEGDDPQPLGDPNDVSNAEMRTLAAHQRVNKLPEIEPQNTKADGTSL